MLAARPEAIGGNFRLDFDGETGFDKWLEQFYAWIRARGFYYGDSGIFVRRAVYERLGGMRPIALMEDYDFVRRPARFGPTICINDPPLVTSSRRFAGRSPAAIVLGWLEIHALFHLGVSPDRLARRVHRWVCSVNGRSRRSHSANADSRSGEASSAAARPSAFIIA